MEICTLEKMEKNHFGSYDALWLPLFSSNYQPLDCRSLKGIIHTVVATSKYQMLQHVCTHKIPVPKQLISVSIFFLQDTVLHCLPSSFNIKGPFNQQPVNCKHNSDCFKLLQIVSPILCSVTFFEAPSKEYWQH